MILAASLAAPAHAHGPGDEFVIALAFWYMVALCAVTVPVSMLLPNRPKGHRVAFGVCVPLAAVTIGAAAAALPVADETGLLLFFGVPVLAALGLILFVIKEKSKVIATK